MGQFASIIVFTEDHHFAATVDDLIHLEPVGLLYLGCYTDLNLFLHDLEVEDDAIVFIYLVAGKKNLQEYLLSLHLLHRKFVCIIPEDGEYAAELQCMKIHYISLPVTKIKILVEIKCSSKKKPLVELIVLPEMVHDDSVKKLKPITIPLGIRYVFKVAGGKRRFYLNAIIRFYMKDRKLYLVNNNHRSFEIKDKFNTLRDCLLEHGFVCSHRSQLMNLNYVDDLKKKDRIYMSKIGTTEFPVGNVYLMEFRKAWKNFAPKNI